MQSRMFFLFNCFMTVKCYTFYIISQLINHKEKLFAKFHRYYFIHFTFTICTIFQYLCSCKMYFSCIKHIICKIFLFSFSNFMILLHLKNGQQGFLTDIYIFLILLIQPFLYLVSVVKILGSGRGNGINTVEPYPNFGITKYDFIVVNVYY